MGFPSQRAKQKYKERLVAMTVIVANTRRDIGDVAQQIKSWLNERGFETQVLNAEYGLLLKAGKSSALRTFFAADRALVIRISNETAVTEVHVRQGSWTKNLASNAGWALATGGTNLAISGWSFVIQFQFESYVRKILKAEPARTR
jgi:hypothetical protein